MSDSKGAAIREQLQGIFDSHYAVKGGNRWKLKDCPSCKDQILAILAQEVNSGILEVLGRINDKAMACAKQKGTGYEELAGVYDKAVMKELADLTQ